MFPLPPSLDGGLRDAHFHPSKDGGNGNIQQKKLDGKMIELKILQDFK
jgi:hypothetical protein